MWWDVFFGTVNEEEFFNIMKKDDFDDWMMKRLIVILYTSGDNFIEMNPYQVVMGFSGINLVWIYTNFSKQMVLFNISSKQNVGPLENIAHAMLLATLKKAVKLLIWSMCLCLIAEVICRNDISMPTNANTKNAWRT